MRPVLIRQLRKAGIDPNQGAPDVEKWEKFLRFVDETYRGHEEDRYLMERAMDLSSAEIRAELEKNQRITVQLAHSGRMASLGTMAAGVAHELNNPLAGILGFLELLSRRGRLSEQEQEQILKMQRLAIRMRDIVRHLLKLSRTAVPSEHPTAKVNEVVQDCVDLCQRQFANDQIRLHFRCPDALYVNGDHNSLVGVIQNLLVNSRDAFLEHPEISDRRIEISAHASGDVTTVIVEDNAGGMPESVLARIFDPFYTTKPVGRGTGLGLAICQESIRQVGGTIRARSTLGKGTTLTIELRSQAEPGNLRPTESATAEPATTTQVANARLRILIVDDETDIAEMLGQALSLENDVVTRTSGLGAMEYFQDHPIDLLITDISMPDISGVALAKRFADRWPQGFIILMSGNPEAGLGALPESARTAWLNKPFSIGDLEAKVRALAGPGPARPAAA